MARNHLTNINKNNSKNNHNNFCLTSCARIYPKPSTIDMKWTLIKDLGKACCNLQSKNKWVIKMSSFRGVASVLQGGPPQKKCVKERVLTRLIWQPPCCVLLKRRFKKKGGGPRAPQDPPGYVPVLWQQASLPPENFLLWLLSYPQNLPESLWPMRATHHTLVKHLMLPPLPPPPFSLQRGVNTSLSLLQRRNPLGSLWIMNKLEEK